jgi:AcrR family transcriptional regulator
VSTRRRWVGTGDRTADALAESRRNEIVDATWRLIATIGLEQTTMRRIADDVGCTTGLVTHYFASKDDVLLAALQKITETSTARMREATRGAAGLERLRLLVLAALPLDEARMLEWRVWLAFWGRAYSSPRLRKEQEARYRRWRRAVHRALADAVALEELPADTDVDAEATHLVAIILGLTVDRIVGGQAGRIDATVAAVDRHLARLAGRHWAELA